MSLSRLLRAGVLCSALLVPVLAAAPMAQAGTAPAKKKHCKKGYVLKGKRCKKKKPVGLGPTGTTSPIGVFENPTNPGPLIDPVGGIVVVGGVASSVNGYITSIRYYATRT